MAVVADVHAHAPEARFNHRIAGVAGREVKFSQNPRMAVRNMVLAVLAEVAPAGINHGGGIEINSGHLHFINRHNQHHAVAPRKTLHALYRGPLGDALGEFIPARLLLGAKVRPVEKLLEAEDLHLPLGRIGHQALVLRDHLFLDVGERKLFRRPFTVRLNEAATNQARHSTPPASIRASLLPGTMPYKGGNPKNGRGSALSRAANNGGGAPTSQHEGSQNRPA